MNKIKNVIKHCIPKRYHKFALKWKYMIFDSYAMKSYSQEGEDIILQRYFEGRSKGFYVDVGAHHPIRFSNTYIFYKMGWHGINIDATPGSMAAFNKARKRDLNLEVPIANSEKDMIYYIFDDPALNSFSKDLAGKIHRDGDCVDTISLKPKRLSDILDEYLQPDLKIDFLNVDVEGLDLEALVSNNWDKYRPELVLVEHLMSSLDELGNDKITQFMKKKGYSLYAKTLNTVFYLESQSKGGGFK